MPVGALGYGVIESLAADLARMLRELPNLLHRFFAALFGGEEMRFSVDLSMPPRCRSDRPRPRQAAPDK